MERKKDIYDKLPSTFIVRVSRFPRNALKDLVGVVEEIGVEGEKGFANEGEPRMSIQVERSPYVLGYSNEEHRRLMLQSRFIGELTETVLARAGLAEGMNVIDIGCGAGDVSILAAAFVGPRGSVLGVDRSADSVTLARQRVECAGLKNIRFEVDTLEDLKQSGPFDALIGRLILMYMPDPAAILRKMAKSVRPGGLVIFQEMEIAAGRAIPEQPLYDLCSQWIRTAFQSAGVETEMGSRLYTIFTQAGLPEPRMISGARVEGGPQSEFYEWLAETVRSLLPFIEKAGVATKEEIDIDTLADRLREDVVAGGGVIYSPLYVGAWARKPA
jgi:ubiquinone/menaquinone biosynthesis C-methylase UbiE